MAAIDFPSSPTSGQLFTPATGITYRWLTPPGIWTTANGPVDMVIASDTPPASPVPNQLWFNSSLAMLYVFYDDGSSQQWVPCMPVPAPQPAVMRGYLHGCTLSRPGTQAIFIDPGEFSDATYSTIITNPAQFLKNTSGAWNPGGSGAGLGNGVSSLPNTWYHVFGARITATGVFDAFFDTSATGANKPAALSAIRRVGSVLTDGSNVIYPFVQEGDWFGLMTGITVAAGITSPGTALVNRTIIAPLGIRTMARVTWTLTNSSATVASLGVGDPATPNSLVGVASNLGVSAGYTQFGTATPDVRTNLLSQVATQVTGIGGSTVTLYGTSMGWFDTRGRLA